MGYAEAILRPKHLNPAIPFWWAKQQEIARALITPPHRVLVKACHSVGKCVGHNEIITLPDGRRVRAEELIGRPFELLTLIDGKPTPVVAKASWNAIETVYRITTETGRQIVRNYAHPLWTADRVHGSGIRNKITNQRWRACGELAPGDIVAMAQELPCFGKRVLPDAEVKLLAYLIGDGGLTQGAAVFTQLDNAQLREVHECAAELGCKVNRTGASLSYRIVGATGERKGLRRHRVNAVLEMLQDYGLSGKGSYDKFVPKIIFELTKRQQSLFLNRLFSTDGWASVSTDGQVQIGYCSCSEQLCREVHELLLRFGLHFRIRKRNTVNAWVVETNNRSECLAFCERIGIFGKEKAARALQDRLSVVQQDKPWRTRTAQAGTRWEEIRAIEVLPAEPTVAIEVPQHHTYLTAFWEHNSHVVAGLINWFFDSFKPGIVLTTSPKYDQVKDVLWKEIRKQRGHRKVNVFPGPKDPRMETGPDHYATGFTANVGAAAQGQHEEYVLGVIDEAVGVAPEIWEAYDSMCTHLLAITNPTDPSSEFYRREQMGNYTVIHISALEHPNIEAELRGERRPYPAAIKLQWLRDRIKEWCDVVTGPPQVTDFEFEGVWYHPGPLAECRLLGRWPSAAGSVWGELLFVSCEKRAPFPFPLGELPQIGCDVARFGDDETTFHVRWGRNSLLHESVNGWSTAQTAGRLKQLCHEYAAYANKLRDPNAKPILAKEIPCKIDDDGVGGGVVDQAEGYCFVGIGPSNKSYADLLYPNKRSELWFDAAERAKEGNLCLSLLPAPTLLKLRLEALAPLYKIDAQGRRVVEPKDITKGRLSRSPDNMDGLNLAYAEYSGAVAQWVDPPAEDGMTMAERLGTLGRPGTPHVQQGPKIRTLGRR